MILLISLRDNGKDPHIKSQLCLAFICIDTYSRFYKIFQGERNFKELDKNNKIRFKIWLDKFVFVSENKIYRENKKEMNCDASIVWELRNSFIHFYSFPRPKVGRNRIGFVFNFSKQKHNKIKEGLKKKGYKVTFIDIYILIKAILEGIILQYKYFADLLKNEPGKYIDGVEFTHDILKEENGITIEVNNR